MKTRFIYLLFLITLFLFASCQQREARIHIASTGDRINPGTADEPLATIDQALRLAGEVRLDQPDRDIRIIFLEKSYSLNKPLQLHPGLFTGQGSGKLIFSGTDNQPVTLSGGRIVSSWVVNDGVWKAVLEDLDQVEQLYVNGERAVRARVPDLNESPQRWYLDSVNLIREKGRSAILQADVWVREESLVPDLAGGGEFEIVVYKDWAVLRKQVAAYDAVSGRIVLKPPFIFFDGNYNGLNAPYVNRFTCYFEGHPSFINQPGEWAFDRRTSTLFYKPKPGQEIENTEVIVPVLEKLLDIKGEKDHPVQNLVFENIHFSHAGYVLPEFGHDGRQACFFYSEGTGIASDQALIPSAVDIVYGEHLTFSNCVFSLTGGNGIHVGTGSKDLLFDACLIRETGGNGLMIGTAADPGLESPELVSEITFKNGEVTRVGRHFDSAVGIWLGFTRSCEIVGNEVHDLPYTGISVGWQWNPLPSSAGENLIADNHIHMAMQMLGDGGGIYTLGNQPGSVIRNNVIHDIRRSELNHASPNNGMFIDEGSKNYLVENNTIYDVSHSCIRGHRAAGVHLLQNSFSQGEFQAISHTPPYGQMIFADSDTLIQWKNPGWPAEWGYGDTVVAFTMEANKFLKDKKE